MTDYGGDPQAALEALPQIASAAGARDYAPCPVPVARAELEAGARLGAHPLFLGQPGYPARLAEIADAPPMLWVLGDIALLDRPMVAIAGARAASSLGLRMARSLAGGLGAAGQVVVSGLARGIDAAAHEAALDTGTIAVFAGGIDAIYPAENEGLAARIAETGLILSEMPPGMRPQARHFPRRNRIISGLARATLVVEAAAKSGSLITAREAADQGREVMAVPGHPFDARAAGCNMLIRDGAALVRGARDVLEALDALPQADRIDMPAADPAPASSAPRAGAEAAPQPAPTPTPARPATPEGDRARDMARAGARHLAKSAAGRAPDRALSRARAEAALRAMPPPGDPDTPLADLAADEARARVLARLAAAPAAEDQILRDTGLSPPAFAAALTDLELDGTVLRSPGGLISRPG